MSKPTELWFKAGVCKAVVNNLKERGYKPQRREYLESIKDVNSAYVIANRYIRKYISLTSKKEKNEFWKEVNRLAKKCPIDCNKWLEIDEEKVLEEVNVSEYDNVIIEESDEQFISKIEEADKSNMLVYDSKSVEVIDENKCSFDGMSLFKMAIEKGVNKFSKKFLDLIGIEKELVGFRDDVELYYCKGVNSIFETV